MRPAALLLLFAAFAACAAEPSVELACSAGTARIALRGGRVLSYVPAGGDVSKIRVGGCGAGLDFAHGNDGARDPGGRRYRIADPVLGREIAIASAGNAQIVVWNGRRGDPPKANVTSDEWKDFVCIEPVVLGSSEAVALSPGESRSLSLSVAVGKLSKEECVEQSQGI